MDVSKFLSKVIGIYLLVVSLAILLNLPQFTLSINSLINNSNLLFVMGFFTLILGILMVVSHSIWQWSWRVLITIIAWITLLKGISIIFYPQFMNTITLLFLQNTTTIYIAAGVDLLLGVLLCYFGFRKRP